MKHAFLFDIDGVLCEPQQPISIEMYKALSAVWLKGEIFYVTGNGYSKAVDLLQDAISQGSTFCNNADELRGYYGRLIWQDTETPPLLNRLGHDLYFYTNTNKIPLKTSYNNSIEWRSPRHVNFCPIGRYANKELRDAHDTSWRPEFIEWLHKKWDGLMDFEAVIGGQVSVDIYSKGADKSRAGKWLNDNGYTFTFFGDKTAPGGNDYPLAEYCRLHPENKCFTVTGPDDTLRLIEQILRGQDEAVSAPTPTN